VGKLIVFGILSLLLVGFMWFSHGVYEENEKWNKMQRCYWTDPVHRLDKPYCMRVYMYGMTE